MIDVTVLRLWCLVLAAWLQQREVDAVTYLVAENPVLRAQLGRQPLRFTDPQQPL